MPELSPNDCDEEEEEDEVDEGLGDESLIFPTLSISEDLSTFASPGGSNEVCCTNVYIKDFLSCVTCVIGFSRECSR